MSLLSIQLQPALSDGKHEHHAELLTKVATSASDDITIERQDADEYLNILFETSDIGQLWAGLRVVIASEPAIAGSAIVCCEGDHGWDDYLLLHHFDPSETVDKLP